MGEEESVKVNSQLRSLVLFTWDLISIGCDGWAKSGKANWKLREIENDEDKEGRKGER